MKSNVKKLAQLALGLVVISTVLIALYFGVIFCGKLWVFVGESMGWTGLLESVRAERGVDLLTGLWACLVTFLFLCFSIILCLVVWILSDFSMQIGEQVLSKFAPQ